MAEWHLRELEERLSHRGWRVEAVEGPDNVQIAGAWEIERGSRSLALDFYGFDDLMTHPMERAWEVRVRGQSLDLYFGKKATKSRPRGAWRRDLDAFIAALDSL